MLSRGDGTAGWAKWARWAILLALLPIATAVGCRACCSPMDYDYAAYGGKWPRSDHRQGRIGSPLSQP
jgi:hypothetical protein